MGTTANYHRFSMCTFGWCFGYFCRIFLFWVCIWFEVNAPHHHVRLDPFHDYLGWKKNNNREIAPCKTISTAIRPTYIFIHSHFIYFLVLVCAQYFKCHRVKVKHLRFWFHRIVLILHTVNMRYLYTHYVASFFSLVSFLL